MRETDKVCIITYSGTVNIILPSTQVKDKEKLYELIDGLRASGITRGGEALNRAYENLALGHIRDANNQLMLATDGKFTELANTERELYQLVRENASMERKISVIGFGQEGTDKFMKNLAKNGGGDYIKISKEADVNELLIREVMLRSLNNKP
jgi:Ca-activated chloride channel family protein